MDRMETAIKSLTGKDAEQAAGNMSSACNTYGLDIKAFLELMTAQEQKSINVWTKICWYWVQKISQNFTAKNYDRRNEQSCYTGYMLIQNLGSKYAPLPVLPRDNFISIYVSKMDYDHKTIQQSFSSLVFAWLDYLAAEKGNKKANNAVKEIKKMYGNRWFGMPMI